MYIHICTYTHIHTRYIYISCSLDSIRLERKENMDTSQNLLFQHRFSCTWWNNGTLLCDFLIPCKAFKSEMSTIFLSALFIHLKYSSWWQISVCDWINANLSLFPGKLFIICPLMAWITFKCRRQCFFLSIFCSVTNYNIWDFNRHFQVVWVVFMKLIYFFSS